MKKLECDIETFLTTSLVEKLRQESVLSKILGISSENKAIPIKNIIVLGDEEYWKMIEEKKKLKILGELG